MSVLKGLLARFATADEHRRVDAEQRCKVLCRDLMTRQIHELSDCELGEIDALLKGAGWTRQRLAAAVDALLAIDRLQREVKAVDLPKLEADYSAAARASEAAAKALNETVYRPDGERDHVRAEFDGSRERANAAKRTLEAFRGLQLRLRQLQEQNAGLVGVA